MTWLRRLARCDRAIGGSPELIVQALLWAAAILSTSWILRGHEDAVTVMLMLTGFASAAVVSGTKTRRCGGAASEP